MIDFTKKILWSSSSFSFRLLSNVFVYIIIARDFGPEKFGQFSIYLLVASIISLVTDFGTHQRLFHYLSIGEAYDKINIIFSIKGLLILTSIVFLIILSILKQDVCFFLVSLSFIFNMIFDWFLIYFRARSEFRKESKYAFFNNILFFISVMLMLNYNESIVYISFTMMICKLLSLFYLFFKNKNIFVHRIKKLSLKDIKTHVFYGLDFVYVNIWTFLDNVVVKNFFSLYLFGVYTSFSRITNGIGSLSGIITNVIFSRIAKEAKVKEKKSLICFSLLFFFLGSFLLTITYIFDDNIIEIVLGKSYSPYSYLLFYLVIPVSLKWISSPLGVFLFSLGYVKERVVIQTLSIVIFTLAFIIMHTYTDSLLSVTLSMGISYLFVFFSYIKIVSGILNEN